SVEVYGFRIEAVGIVPKPELPKEEPVGTLIEALREYRNAYFEETGGFINTPIYHRPSVPVGSIISGPAVVEQLDSTVIIPPDFVAEVDNYKNIIISLKGVVE